MRFLTAVIGTSLLMALPVGPAFAQDFDGPYLGVQAGWDLTDVRDPETELGTLSLDEDRNAFTGGFYAGYDRQVAPRIVVGAEAGVDFGADDAIKRTTATGLVSFDPDWSVDLTGRAGYLLGSSTLAYVRGGYTNARLETNLITPQSRLSASENRDGWLVGAGIERQITDNTSARLEYRYSDLSEGDRGYDRSRLLAGFTYRF